MAPVPDKLSLLHKLSAKIPLLPAEHIEAAQSVYTQLYSLFHHFEEIRADCLLFEQMRQLTMQSHPRHGPNPNLGMWQAWARLAARDAVMNFFHFDKALDALLKRYAECTSWKDKADWSLLRTLQPAFVRDFPQTPKIRKAVAHQAELMSSPEKYKENAIKNPGGGLMWRVANVYYHNWTFEMTIEGELVYIELSAAQFGKLHEIVNNAFMAFEPVASAESPSQ